MPLAGRLADLWGARRLFLWALVVFTVGSLLAGAAPTLEMLIAARLVQAVGGGRAGPGRDGGRLAPVRGRRPAARARPDRRADVPRAWRPARSSARRSWARSTPRRRWSRLGVEAGRPRRRPGARLALGVLRQRPDRDRGPRGRLGREQRLGDAASRRAASTSSGAILFSRRPRGRARRADAARQPRGPESGGLDPTAVAAVLAAVAVVAGSADRRPRAAPAATRSSTRGCSATPGSLGGARLAADRLRASRRRSSAARCSSTACSTAAPTSSASRSAPWPGRRPSARSCRGSSSGVLSLRLVTLVGPGGVGGALVAMSGWTTATPVDGRGRRPRRVRPGLRADGHAALDGRGRGRRARGLRDGRVDGDRGPDGRHGASGSRSSPPTARPRSTASTTRSTRRPTRTRQFMPRRAPGPAAARRAGDRGARDVGGRRGGARSWSGCSSSRRW